MCDSEYEVHFLVSVALNRSNWCSDYICLRLFLRSGGRRVSRAAVVTMIEFYSVALALSPFVSLFGLGLGLAWSFFFVSFLSTLLFHRSTILVARLLLARAP